MARRILIGSTNPSKIEWLKGYLSEIPDTECVTLKQLGITVTVDEEGKTPKENARIKALAYHRATGLAVIGHDAGLYFREFARDDPRQPGLYIRRVNGKVLDDDGMLAHYQALARDYGPLHACYFNGFAVVDEAGNCQTFSQDQVDNEACFNAFGFLMCSEPHPIRRAGWPLDSLSKDPQTGEYWYDQGESRTIAESDFSSYYHNSVTQFFKDCLKNKQA